MSGPRLGVQSNGRASGASARVVHVRLLFGSVCGIVHRGPHARKSTGRLGKDNGRRPARPSGILDGSCRDAGIGACQRRRVCFRVRSRRSSKPSCTDRRGSPDTAAGTQCRKMAHAASIHRNRARAPSKRSRIAARSSGRRSGSSRRPGAADLRALPAQMSRRDRSCSAPIRWSSTARAWRLPIR